MKGICHARCGMHKYLIVDQYHHVLKLEIKPIRGRPGSITWSHMHTSGIHNTGPHAHERGPPDIASASSSRQSQVNGNLIFSLFDHLLYHCVEHGLEHFGDVLATFGRHVKIHKITLPGPTQCLGLTHLPLVHHVRLNDQIETSKDLDDRVSDTCVGIF